MKGLNLAEWIGIALVVSSVTFLVLCDLVGQDAALVVFKWAWMAFVVALAVNLIFGFFERGEYRSAIRRRNLRKIDRKIEALNFLQAENHHGFFHLDIRSGESRADFAPVAPRRITVNRSGADPVGIEHPAEPVLPMVRNAVSLFVQGDQGAGKTTLLHHLHDEWKAVGDVVVLDAHGYPGKFGPETPVIGCGRDYDAIDKAMVRILETMNRRYQDDYHLRNHIPMTILVDEYSLLYRQCPTAKAFVESALTEFRKVGLRLVAAVHSLRARYLNLAGGMDMAEGAYQLELKSDQGRFWGELAKYNRDPVIVSLPGPHPRAESAVGHGHGDHGSGGPFPGSGAWQDDRDGRDSRDDRDHQDPLRLDHDPNGGPAWSIYEEPRPRRFFESRMEREAVEMAEGGSSLNAIARKIWGAANGRRTKAIKRILRRHDIL